MQIKFESMQARQVVSSRLHRSFVRLRRSKRRLGASLHQKRLFAVSGIQQNRVRTKLYNCGACVCKSNVEIRIAGSLCRPQLYVLVRFQPFRLRKMCTLKRIDLPQVVFLSDEVGQPKSSFWATKSRGDELSRLHGFEFNLHIVGGKLLRWRHGCVVSKINSSWMNFRCRYSLNRSKLRPCWRKDEFRRISLSLLHFCTVLHYFNPYTYIGVKCQRESRRQQKRTLDRRKAAERKVAYNW